MTFNPTIDQADVLDALAACVLGRHDIVQLPADEDVWTLGAWETGGITVPPDVQLLGAGVGQTILKIGVTADSPFIQVNGGEGFLNQVKGIEIQDNGSTPNSRGVLLCNGSQSSALALEFLIDHNRFNNLPTNAIQTINAIGVACQNVFNLANNSHAFSVFCPKWKGVGEWGDNSWACPTNFGTGEFFFIEDNYIESGAGNHFFGLDVFQGGRVVFRHNHCVSAAAGLPHGTETGGRYRSPRCGEFYLNVMEGAANGLDIKAFHFRGGTGVVWGNTLTNYLYPMSALLEYYRCVDTFGLNGLFVGWSGCNGESAWDVNDPTIYATGTHVGSTGAVVLTANGSPGWTVNQWVGYQVCNVTGGRQSVVVSNTSNTITYLSSGHNSPLMMEWTNGDTFQLRKVIKGIDQPGTGQCDLLDSAEDVSPVVLNHAIESVYGWGNTMDGVPVGISSGYPIIQSGVHFKDEVMPGYSPYVYPHPLNDMIPTPTPPIAPSNLILTPLGP